MNNLQNQDPLTHEIIGAAKEVHRALGTRLLEELYEDAFCIELEERKLKYQRQRHIYVVYKGRDIGDMVADIVVHNAVIVELKAVESLNQIHFAQLMTYMKLMNLRKGTAHQLQCTISEGRYQAHSPLVHSLCALCASVVNLPPIALGHSRQIYMTKVELLLCTRCLRLNFNQNGYTTYTVHWRDRRVKQLLHVKRAI